MSSSSSSELRILLLGPKNAGKSSAGNIILGIKEFFQKKTLHCVEKHSEIAGTKITIIDTPGWWGKLPFEENPELYKQEIVLSLTKCPPGPHVLLLVLNVDTPFKQNERDVLCDNMRYFGEEAWRHTIVLLTCADKTNQQLENENLHWLIEMCGNRYHKINTKNGGHGSQVSELLKKMQAMVESNRGSYYEINRDTLEHVEMKRREQEKRAVDRRSKIHQIKDRTSSSKKHHLSEMRMVLLGYNGSGKSSAGNTILGKPAFNCKRSLTSTIREGDIAGRRVTVVDTPGRKRNYCSKYTPRLYKDEIVLSSSLCPPGPNVFLLVIRIDVSFTEVYRKAVEEHAACHGLEIWDHMIVLFTFGDWLGDTNIELFIESEGEALQWIVDKCGNRYHVFNNRNIDDHSQVAELFEKIEEMVAENKGQCFKIDHQNLQKVKERRIKIEERAKQIRDEIQKRNRLRRSVSGSVELSEITLVLLGSYCCSKSSTGNTILGREVFNRKTEENQEENGEVAGRKLTVVYTPGFEKDYLTGERLEDAKLSVWRSATESSTGGTHAFIFVQSVDSSFAYEEMGALEKIMEPLGERVWKHTMILFAVGDETGETPIDLCIASEGDALQRLIEKCGNRFHVLNNKNWGDGSQVTELLKRIEEMVESSGGCQYKIDRENMEHGEEMRRKAEKGRMTHQHLKHKTDKETLERVKTSDPVPIKKQRSMDIPLNIAEGSSLASESSAYLSQSIISQEAHTKFRFNKSLRSEMTSGVESLDSIPDSEGQTDSE